jgi:hypothetical protein
MFCFHCYLPIIETPTVGDYHKIAFPVLRGRFLHSRHTHREDRRDQIHTVATYASGWEESLMYIGYKIVGVGVTLMEDVDLR